MRYVAVIALVAVTLGGLARAGVAADPTWQVSVGFGGVARDGAWTPVFADITNEDDARVGHLVVFLSVPGMKNRVVPYATEVELPRHAKKRYTIYVPSAGDIDSVRLEVSGYRGERRASRMDVADAGALVVCVVGGDGGYLSFLNGQTGLGVGPARAPQPNTSYGPFSGPAPSRSVKSLDGAVGHLDWSGLPESWLGWEGASAVVLADANFSAASPAALEALRTWVQCGGTLVVPGGALAPAVATGPFASLLPAAMTGTTNLPDLAPLGAWAGRPLPVAPVLAAQLAPQAEAEVLCGRPEQPLIVSRRAGAGRVIMTSFDYTGAPVKYWDGQRALWSKLLVPRTSEYTLAREAESFEPNQTTDLFTTAATMPQAELPSIWLVIGFLIAYIVVLVPVNYHVLHRLNRRELAWVTTPGIVLLFTFGAYGMGYALRGGAIRLNRIGIVEAGAGSPVGHGNGYLGIFSPARRGYEVAINAPAAGTRDLSSSSDPHLRSGTVIFTASKPRVAGVNMNMWTTRSFAVDYCADLGKGVSGYIESDGVNLVARVRNDTGLTLKNCRIVRGGAQGRSKDLRPGESGEISFVHGQGTSIPAFQPYSSPGGSSNLGQMTLAALFNNGQSPTMPGTETLPVLVARVDDLAVPATLAGERPDIQDVSLLVVHLPLRLTPRRDVQVPEWLVAARYIASSGTISGGDRYSGSGEGLEIERGSVTIEYTLPLAGMPVEVKQLELISNDLPTADISAYDYTAGSWQVLASNAVAAPVAEGAGSPGGPPGAPMSRRMPHASPSGGAPGRVAQQKVTIPHARDFVSPEGKVQVKVSTPSGAAHMSPLSLRARVVTR